MLPQILICFMLLLSVSCVEKEDHIDYQQASLIDITQAEKNLEVRLASLFGESRFIPLMEIAEIDALASIDKVIEHKNKFFVLDKKKSNILVFDQSGKFLNKVGIRGGGPKEYESIFDFDIDKKNDEIIILDAQIRLTIYNSKNDFVRKVDFKGFYPESLSVLAPNVLACSIGYIEPGQYAIKIVDTKTGTPTGYFGKYPDDYDDYKSFGLSGGMNKSADKVYFTYKSSSVILSLDNELNFTPVYRFNFGPKTWPEEQKFDLPGFDAKTNARDVAYLTNKYYVDSNMIAFSFINESMYNLAYYFKDADKTYIPQNKADDLTLRFLEIPVGKSSTSEYISGLQFERFEIYKELSDEFTGVLQNINPDLLPALDSLNYENSDLLFFYNFN